MGRVAAGGAVGVAAEFGVLGGGEEAVAVDEHLVVVDEGAKFAGFRRRVSDPAVVRGGAIEAERVVLEDERGIETVLDPLVGDESDVFGGHWRKNELGFGNCAC